MIERCYAEASEEIDDRIVTLRKRIEHLPGRHQILISRCDGYADRLEDILKSTGLVL